MAWRIAESVVRGWVDNRVQGRVTGQVYLLGREEPLDLELRGDADPDVAGCRIEFSNLRPAAEELSGLAAAQEGITGNITCSRKCRVPDVPIEAMEHCRGRQIPSHLANVLYIEWFGERNGRVVIESASFRVRISERAWTMTEEEARHHAEAVRKAMLGWADRLERAVEESREPAGEDDGGPWDEFAWERFMRECDGRTERFGRLLEQYEGHPDRDRIVAREMGWWHLDEALDAEEQELLSEPDDDLAEPGPDRLAEGRDWVRGEDGRPVHPLVLRARNVTKGLWDACRGLGLIGPGGEEECDADIGELVFSTRRLSTKLAGALCSLPTGPRPESGFIVAYLKRAMPFLNRALAAEARVRAGSRLPAPVLNQLRAELFAIRASILDLMERSRTDPG